MTVNDFETGVCVGYLLHKDDGSSIILDTFTTAQNGHWTAQSGHAWNDITVNVPTYEQEYRQMQAECEKVKEAIKPYDPTLPVPWDPIHDPTQPTIHEEIDKIAGYEPSGNPTHGDVVDALVPLGGGDVDTVGTGTAGNYTYRIEFAGFARDAYAMLNPITGQPINDIITSTLWADFTPGEWHAGDGGRIYPVIKITVDGVGWGYANAPGFLNGGSGWPIICDSEWKFGIADITAYNDGAGNRVITTFYPASAGWVDYGVYFGSNTVTKDSVTTKVYTQQ